ncbi:MAG: metallophosphoesterase, partial [Desulfobacterales bacterium]|nr:metallophosphoesterase [Desulfobacterales bacterium]
MKTNATIGIWRKRAIAARLMSLFCLGLVIFPLIGGCQGLSPEFTGKVFLDLNGNNLPDPGERGIEGVLVTNGEDFKRTDAEGNFRLSSARAMNIWISSPRGYQPVEGFFLPVEPSRSEYNFGLSPAIEGKEEMVRVAFASDLHLSDDPSISSQVEVVVEAIQSTQPHMVFILGDLHGDANSAEALRAESIFKEVNQFREKLIAPSYCALGNHDIFGWSAEGDSPSKHPLFG